MCLAHVLAHNMIRKSTHNDTYVVTYFIVWQFLLVLMAITLCAGPSEQ